jgi:hypothetical protein
MMHVTAFSDSSSLLPPSENNQVRFGTKEVGTVETSVRRLDDYRREHDRPFPDLIKLDVQGYELEVLTGAEECLASAKAVIAEVSFVDYYEGQAEFHEVVGFLARFGLFLQVLGVQTPVGTVLQQADALFLKRDMHNGPAVR